MASHRSAGAARAGPLRAASRRGRGRARSRAGTNDQGAVEDFDKASANAPEWSDPWYRAGRILDRLGRADDANLRFRRAFELGHKDPWLLDRITALGG